MGTFAGDLGQVIGEVRGLLGGESCREFPGGESSWKGFKEVKLIFGVVKWLFGITGRGGQTAARPRTQFVRWGGEIGSVGGMVIDEVLETRLVSRETEGKGGGGESMSIEAGTGGGSTVPRSFVSTSVAVSGSIDIEVSGRC